MKSNSGNVQATKPLLDTAITDTSIYVDITLNGVRTFGIENSETNQWSWG